MEITKAIQEASAAAEAAPAELRETAFKTVLEHILRQADAPAADHAGVDGRRAQGSGGAEEAQGAAETGETLPEAHLVKSKGSRRQQALWAMLALHARGEEVATENVVRLIRSELGIAPQSLPNTARTMRGLTPRYVMRRDRPDGRGYVYEPTPRSYELFEDLG